MILSRAVPRSDERHRTLGLGYPMWMLASQFFIVLFVFVDFGTVKLNPKPHFILSMVVLACMMLFAPRGLLRRVRISTPVLLLFAWWVLSYVWSPIPGTWLNTSSTQLSAVVILTIVASVLPFERVIRTWLGSVYAMIVYTLLYTAAFPGKATILNNTGTGELVNVGWHGPFNHKNNMASFMVFGIAFVLSFEPNPRRRHLAVLAMVFLVVMSRSGTGSGTMIAVLLSLYWTHRYSRTTARRASTLIVVSFLSSVVAVIAIASFLPAVAKVYGKDLTFSGRTEIWSAALDAIRAKPWTGYSWGGVWTDPTKEPTFTIVRRLGFIVFHAHNGAIEIMIELGAIGLVLFLAVLWCTASGGWRLLHVRPALGQVVVCYCVLVTVASVSEVLVLGPWLSVLVMLRALSLRVLSDDDPEPKNRTTRAVAPRSDRATQR